MDFSSDSDSEDDPVLYLIHLISGIRKSRDDNEFCDITIQVGKKIFHAHKVILASSCKYFHRMFSSGFREASADVITLEGDGDTFEIVLNFIYTGAIAFTKLNAKQLKDALRMVCYLQFDHAIECCKKYLRQLLKNGKGSLQTAYETSLVCDSQGDILNALRKVCSKFYHHNFSKLSSKVEFYEETSKGCLEMCIDNISWIDWKTSEEDLGLMINKWLSFDLDSRKSYAADLLKKLRLGLLTQTTFIALKEQTRDIQEYKDIFDEVMRLRNIPLSELMGATLDYSYPSQFAPRATITTLIACGYTEDKECNRYLRLPGTHWERLLQVPPLPKPLQGHSSVNAKGKLYVAGGFDLIEEWIEGEPESGMPKYMDNYFQPPLYLEERNVLKTDFWRFDGTMDQWEVLPPMPRPRCNFALLNMEHRLLFIGGKGEGDTVLRSVDCYDILSQHWSSINPLLERVLNPSAVFTAGRMYVYGLSVESLDTYVLQMYLPLSELDDTSSSSQGGSWQVVLQEQLVVPSYLSDNIKFKPFITVQHDKCYRVAIVDKHGESSANYQVHELKLYKPGDVCVGPEESQKITGYVGTSWPFPIQTLLDTRVFCIAGRVYVGYGTCAFNTGISIDDNDGVRNLINIRQHQQNTNCKEPGPDEGEISYCIFTFDEKAKGSVGATGKFGDLAIIL